MTDVGYGHDPMSGARKLRARRIAVSLALFERRLCRRNPVLGEASEEAIEAPSEF